MSGTDRIALYETMLLIRQFELTASRLGRENRLIGNLHSCAGQEAVPAGVCAALRPGDWATSTHRGHGHAIAKGVPIERLFAELFGRLDGPCKGKFGTMHITDPDHGLLLTTAIVGGGLPSAAGAALSAQSRGSDQVSVVFLGEGAVAQGVFHETLNLAVLWRLPLVLVCENNQYAEMTHYRHHLAAPVHQLAEAYELPVWVVDGNDVDAVAGRAHEAVGAARAGDGPALLECRTYRLSGHYEGDPEHYRTKDEVAEWRARDPIARLRAQLEPDVGSAELDAVQERVGRRVDDAIEAALGAAPTPVEELLSDVYAVAADG